MLSQLKLCFICPQFSFFCEVTQHFPWLLRHACVRRAALRHRRPGADRPSPLGDLRLHRVGRRARQLGRRPTPRDIVAIGLFMPLRTDRRPHFSDDEIAALTSLVLEVARAQPLRQFCFGFLIDGRNIQFFRFTCNANAKVGLAERDYWQLSISVTLSWHCRFQQRRALRNR